jgi:hypothetical protein
MAWQTGGRLPTLAEVNALLQTAQPCATKITWPAPPQAQSVWTSTPDPQNSTFYYTVFFDGTPALSAPEGDSHWVLCVK